MNSLDLILHLDQHIGLIVHTYHNYFYLLFFLVIFCETGLVITPFLPGDALLFIAGGLAGSGQLNIVMLIFLTYLAALLGDNTNFFIGRYLGTHLFTNHKSKIFRKDFLDKTHDFYERHGRKTIIIARLLPILRTFAPFVAGLGDMRYKRFIIFSLLASLLWVSLFLGGGFLIGNIPVIKNHLSILILLIVIFSCIPLIKLVIDELPIGRTSRRSV